MIEAGQHICNDGIVLNGSRPAVSIAIDAGTIESRRFLDIILLALYTRLKPFLYTAVEQTRLTTGDYGNIVANAIRDLRQAKVNIRSIVGDNLPAKFLRSPIGARVPIWEVKKHFWTESNILRASVV
jgi:hypothetical protein